LLRFAENRQETEVYNEYAGILSQFSMKFNLCEMLMKAINSYCYVLKEIF